MITGHWNKKSELMVRDYMGGLVNSRTREETIEKKEEQGVKE